MKLGILAAMREEIASILGALEQSHQTEIGLRTYHLGTLHGTECVLAYSRIGKVAAASTATQLVDRFKVDRVLFTGLAGGVGHGVRRGDIVIGTELIQHDLDASPLFPRHEVPLLGVQRFITDVLMNEALFHSARAIAETKCHSVHSGLIATGDRFFSCADAVEDLRRLLPETLCVEMEGAAVAQVCHEYGIPFSIVRTISDSADETAVADFPRFLKTVAGPYALAVVEGFLRRLSR
ncbi:MAG: 5'-methylthioadenosine/adenosylhomocysteine nucleosidase [Bdellovibrionales bacterium]|nr:5'-methylthioadenosine/adenosylhomocysteine nucleosidase [Bdellovibrionales bacterium]